MAKPDFARYPRFVANRVRTALKDTPVVMVVGPRQSGKTTLVRDFAGTAFRYLTLDDETTLAAARADPSGFLRNLDRAILDEVQRAPDLLRAIKKTVDQDRRPGRFLLTGSANVLTLPMVSESLAGRMEVISLLPLSQPEILRHRPNFLRKAFAGTPPPTRAVLTGDDLVQAVLAGGYPEMLRRPQGQRRQAWARDYIRALVQRDVREIAQIDKLGSLSKLLRVLACHSGQLINFSVVGGQVGLDDKTTRKYLGVFEQLFLLRPLEPWHNNRLSRLLKTPKLHFLDSGLLAALQGVTLERIRTDRTVYGPLLETFVFAELLKQVEASGEVIALHHYRDKDGDEVDIVMENGAGELVGIEVKAGATVTRAAFKGLDKIAQATGKAFRLGLVAHDGEAVVPFGDRLFAVPVSNLWS